MFKKLSWKLAGIFLLKLCLYILIIPILAALVQEFALRIALPILFHVDKIHGPASIGMQMWAMIAFVLFSCIFYIYVLSIHYVKSKFNRRLMRILFIVIPSLFGGVQFANNILLSMLGNLLYNSSYYFFYHIFELYIPSLRSEFKN